MVLQKLLNPLPLCPAVLRQRAGPLPVGLLACGASLGWAQPAVPASAAAAQTSAAEVVRYCVAPDWPPFEEIDAKGQHVGIAAELLRAVVRNVGSVTRWGGEKFLVICPATQPQQALVLAERILLAVRAHVFGIQPPITVSAGLASLQPGQNPDTLFTQADEALLQAKRQGRDRLVVFDPKEAFPWP